MEKENGGLDGEGLRPKDEIIENKLLEHIADQKRRKCDDILSEVYFTCVDWKQVRFQDLLNLVWRFLGIVEQNHFFTHRCILFSFLLLSYPFFSYGTSNGTLFFNLSV